MKGRIALLALVGVAHGFLHGLARTSPPSSLAHFAPTRATLMRSTPPDDGAFTKDGDQDMSLDEMKKELEQAQKDGDTMKVITLMGTIFALEGQYEGEGESGEAGQPPCADV